LQNESNLGKERRSSISVSRWIGTGDIDKGFGIIINFAAVLSGWFPRERERERERDRQTDTHPRLHI